MCRRLKPGRLVQVVNGPLAAKMPLRPKPSLIFGEGMWWLLQLSQTQLFPFPLSEQSRLRPAAWWRVCVCVSKRKHAGIVTRCMGYVDEYKQKYTQVIGQPQARRRGSLNVSQPRRETCDLCTFRLKKKKKKHWRRWWGRFAQRTRGGKISDVDVCVRVWLMRCPFGLAEHWLHHNSVPATTAYLWSWRCLRC